MSIDTMKEFNDLVRRDLAALWHPCSQMKDHESLPMIPIRRGEGVWLEDMNGKRYLDAVSSWWVNLFGHANPRINAAVKQQLDDLEQVILAGFTHRPAIELAEQLVSLTPAPLQRVFYADSGSAAVEVAMKMSFHYWLNQGRTEKTRFINLQNGYHGETVGALALGDVALYKQTYAPLLMDVITAPSPDCYQRATGESWEAHSLRMIEPMRALLEQHAHEVCAIIVEPLVQCAGNMRMYHPVYLTGLRKLCDEYEVHLIADEIAVGFGRTGTLFACEQAGISPDFMCLSKGLTSGYLPLSAVLTTEQVYQAFYADYTSMRAFLHSHSFTGNPLACSAALASLQIFATDNVLERNRRLAVVMQDATAHLIDHPHVGEVRQTGMILAIEMVSDKKTRQAYDWRERRGLAVYKYALEKGALLRPLGDVVYFMPPYVITEEQIRWLADIAEQAINHATNDQ
jgi:adenosylmethionine-8-amino-7-oxononanoate aminotransferase